MFTSDTKVRRSRPTVRETIIRSSRHRLFAASVTKGWQDVQTLAECVQMASSSDKRKSRRVKRSTLKKKSVRVLDKRRMLMVKRRPLSRASDHLYKGQTKRAIPLLRKLGMRPLVALVNRNHVRDVLVRLKKMRKNLSSNIGVEKQNTLHKYLSDRKSFVQGLSVLRNPSLLEVGTCAEIDNAYDDQ